MKFSLPSPAKINRFLHITGRQANGYHTLQTLFQFLDYGDMLSFETREDSSIVITTSSLMGPPENNLVYRAAIALQNASQTRLGVTIHLDKILPIGAGLGGGSSNAATTLLALNAFWQLHWEQAQLLALGKTLGADVPVFLLGHSAWGEGIGEQLTPVSPAEPWFVVVTPPSEIITAKIFVDPDLTRDTPPFKIGSLAGSELESLLDTLKNDFEPLVCRRYPEVEVVINWLSDFGQPRLSGSGASVFCCFPSLEQATIVAKQLPSCWKGFVAKGRNQSPVLQAIGELNFK